MLKQIVIFLFILAFLIGLGNIGSRFLPAARLISSSMEPAYSQGDLVFYMQSKDYKVNDVIVHKAGNSILVDRITVINSDGTFNAKGDANSDSAPAQLNIQKEQIVGKIVFGAKSYIFYPSLYILQSLIAVFLAFIISKKLAKEKPDSISADSGSGLPKQ